MDKPTILKGNIPMFTCLDAHGQEETKELEVLKEKYIKTCDK